MWYQWRTASTTGTRCPTDGSSHIVRVIVHYTYVESWGGRTKMSLRISRLVASLGRVFGDEDARRDMTRLGEDEEERERTDFGFDLAVFLTQLIDKT